MPITPFPTLFTTPVYRQQGHVIELTISNFFYEDPKTHTQVPLDVYLGNLGPLRHRVYQASPPFVQPMPGPGEAVLSEGGAGAPTGMRYVPPVPTGPIHTIVIVEMPPIAEVLKALEEDALPASGEGSTTQTEGNRESKGSVPPIPIPHEPRSLPLLFIRPVDGVGYHSGRTIACESVFSNLDLGNGPSNGAPGIDTNWLTAAAADGAWTLRVL
jgi:recombining binding protein suppressor of hairless